MNAQMLITWISIGVAAAFLVINLVRAWRGKGCKGGCGCAKSAPAAKQQPTLIAPEDLKLRSR